MPMAYGPDPLSRTVMQFGAKGDGITDDTSAWQTALSFCAEHNEALWGNSGIYKITSALKVPSRLCLFMMPDCVLLRAYTAGGTTGLLMQDDMTSKISDVFISGGTIRNLDTTTYTGNQICFNGDDLHIENIRIDEWGGTSRAMLLAGDRLRLDRIWAKSSGQGGGIRYIEGDDFLCSNSYVECGDDCYNFVPGGTGSLLFDGTIRRGQYLNCVGYSFNGRLFLAALSGSGTLDMSGSILDCAFIGIRGRAGNRAFVIYNEDSSGVVARTDITDCMIDCSEDVSSGNSGYINGQPGTGGVSEVRIRGLTLLSPYQEALEVSGIVDRVYCQDFSFDAPRTSGQRTVDFNSVSSGAFRNGYVRCNGATSGLVLGASAAVSNVLIENVQIDQIDNSQGGIQSVASTNLMVRGCKFTERSGQTSARALILSSSTFAPRIENNDYSNITASEKISGITAGLTQQIRIRQNIGLLIDNGDHTIRQWESGQSFTNKTASALTTYALPTAIPSFEYTVINEIASGMKLMAGAGATINDGGVVSSPGGNVQSTTIGGWIRVKATSSTSWVVLGKGGSWSVA